LNTCSFRLLFASIGVTEIDIRCPIIGRECFVETGVDPPLLDRYQ